MEPIIEPTLADLIKQTKRVLHEALDCQEATDARNYATVLGVLYDKWPLVPEEELELTPVRHAYSIEGKSESGEPVRILLPEDTTLAEAWRAAESLYEARVTEVAVAVVAYTHVTMAALDLSDATDFWQSTADLAPSYRGDPVVAFARRLAYVRRNRSRIPGPTMLSLIYRTWNRRRAGQTADRRA